MVVEEASDESLDNAGVEELKTWVDGYDLSVEAESPLGCVHSSDIIGQHAPRIQCCVSHIVYIALRARGILARLLFQY